MRKLLVILSMLLVQRASAQLMTVKDLDDMVTRGGKPGEVAAVAYVQGVMDGMIGMDSLHQKEQHTPPEFCRFSESYKHGKPELHPAFRAKEIISAWKQDGYPMNTLAVDMILTYLSSEYGCKR